MLVAPFTTILLSPDVAMNRTAFAVGVTTDSADAAAPKLKEALATVYDARDALKGIKQLSEADAAEVKERYEKPMREEWGKLYREIFRLQQVKCYNSEEFFKLFSYMCLMLEK